MRDQLPDRFDELGRAVARELPGPPDDQLRQTQESRLLNSLAALPERGARQGRFVFGLRWGFAIGAAMAAALILVFWRPWSPAVETAPFCVQRGSGPIASGAWLDGTAQKAAVLDFNNGSVVSTEGRTRFQLRKISAAKVRVVIGRGKLRSQIKPGRTRWSFAAGPYETHVLGTTLSVQWKPERGQLVVGVEKGRVRVKGGAIPAGGMLVRAGKRLNVASGQITLQATRTASADAGDRAADASLTAPSAQPDASVSQAPRLSMRWRTLAQEGQYREAVGAAKAQGIGRLLSRLHGRDLLLLADASRFARDLETARRALIACRRRYPATAHAHQAAFRLGRIAVEGKAAPMQAAHWFRLFLREAPRSPLRADAMARLMLALERGGKKAAAAKVARQYLKQYSRGAYAAAAKRCLTGVGP